MTDPREPYGRLVRQVWVTWAAQQENPEPSWLLPWMALDDGQREVDMRIGHAVADCALEQNALTWNTDCGGCAGQLDRAYGEHVRAEQAEAKLAGIGSALREHYLAGISCDRARHEDNPVCACSRVFLGWHPSVGEAVEAWIVHVMEMASSDEEGAGHD